MRSPFLDVPSLETLKSRIFKIEKRWKTLKMILLCFWFDLNIWERVVKLVSINRYVFMTKTLMWHSFKMIIHAMLLGHFVLYRTTSFISWNYILSSYVILQTVYNFLTLYTYICTCWLSYTCYLWEHDLFNNCLWTNPK